MRTAEEAIRAARRESVNGRTNYQGMCLKFVRQMWGLPGGWPDANAAWEAVPDQHRHGGASLPGSVIFWSVGEHGHCALSIGHGFCLSTDIRRRGKIDVVPTVLISTVWRAQLRGWSSWLNGQALPI